MGADAVSGAAHRRGHATLGTITLPGPPLRFFDANGAELTRRLHTAPPVLGADNDLIAATLQAERR
jgi:hypothetical protein